MNLTEYYNTLVERGEEVTDKGTDHDYINGYYNELLTPLQDKPINLLEIGIDKGYSITLFRDFLPNATIDCFDGHAPSVESVKDLDRVNAYLIDGYISSTSDMYPDNHFDVIIDDGPHSLLSQIKFMELWLPKLKVGGVAVVEDIQNPDENSSKILDSIPDKHKYSIRVVDLRPNKLRSDDYIIEVIKNEA